MKEIRIYAIDDYEYKGDTYELDLPDDEFMDIAESQGYVFTIDEFINAFNKMTISESNLYIRRIDVEVPSK